MIGQLKGTITHKGLGYVILETAGVGYKVAVTTDTYSKLKEAAATTLWTHLVVREDVLDLYGFRDEDELSFFEMLIGVSGIGPKSALAILSLETAETLRGAISSSDSSYLTKVSGIGKKNAEKIILELKDRVGGDGSPEKHGYKSEDAEVLEALLALGYNLREGREALKRVEGKTTDTSARLKGALKELSGKS